MFITFPSWGWIATSSSGQVKFTRKPFNGAVNAPRLSITTNSLPSFCALQCFDFGWTEFQLWIFMQFEMVNNQVCYGSMSSLDNNIHLHHFFFKWLVLHPIVWMRVLILKTPGLHQSFEILFLWGFLSVVVPSFSSLMFISAPTSAFHLLFHIWDCW